MSIFQFFIVHHEFLSLLNLLQTVLNRLHNEGLQVLSLSDLRYLQQQTTARPNVQDGTDLVLLQDAFAREKEALLDAIQALKDLVTQATAGLRVSSYIGGNSGQMHCCIPKLDHDKHCIDLSEIFN